MGSESCKYCYVHYQDLQIYGNIRCKERARVLPFDHTLHELVSENIYCPDIFHDFNEGVIHKTIPLIIKKIYGNDLSLLFQHIKTIKWKHGPIKGVNMNVRESKIKGSGMQVNLSNNKLTELKANFQI